MTRIIQYITAILLVTVFGFILYSVIAIEKSHENWERVVFSAEQLAVEDVENAISKGQLYFLIATYGAFNPNEVPGLESDKMEICFPSGVKTKVFYEGTDVPVFENEEEKYLRLVDNPRSTWIYASKFNSLMYKNASIVGATNCT